MHFYEILCFVIIFASFSLLNESRSYNNGLIFYNLENHQIYLPPTVSVSRGRGLANLKYSARGSIWSTFGRPCDCDGPLCGCCVGIKVKQYNFDQKMCANVSYVPRKDEIQLEVFLNETSNAKYGISARDPSPLCIPIMMGIPMSMCIKMSNVGLQGDNLNMCMDFLVRLASTELFEMHFQCIKVGLQGAGWVGPDGQPVIPASEGKLTDKSDKESEEYYDEEDEEENEILSKEEQKKKEQLSIMNIEEEDVNKAEEEMDYNDIADKVMDIVKEQEQEEADEMEEDEELLNDKEMEEFEKNKMSTGDMQKIVTNIMESIKDSHDKDETEMITETSIDLGTEASDFKESAVMSSVATEKEETAIVEKDLDNKEKHDATETIESVTVLENEENPVKESTSMEEIDSFKEETVLKAPEIMGKEEIKVEKEPENEKEETSNIIVTNEVIDEHTVSEDIVNNSQKEELNLETDQAIEKEMKNESLQDINDSNEPTKDILVNYDASIIKLQEEFYETTTQHMANELESSEIEKFEMFINNSAEATTKTQQIDNEQNNSMELLQQSMESNTEHLITANTKPTVPQIATTTSEIDNIDSVDNTLTTATIVTTTTTTKTPLASNENSIVAVTFIENANDHKEKIVNNNKVDNDDTQNKDKENVNGDNSHENDSDYDEEDEDDDEEEESEELEDETTEENANDATTTIKIITTANDLNKETSTTERLTTAADVADTESQTTNKTKETTKKDTEKQEEKENKTDISENDEEEEDDDEEEENESHTEKLNDSEEYYDEYEDYESTTLAVSDLTTQDTCCKSSTPSLAVDTPVITTTSTTSLIEHLNDNTNKAATQLQTNTSNNLQFLSYTNSNISSDDSSDMLNMESTTSKISQITLQPAATAAATTTPSSSTSNILPLPLARQLFALQHQQQQRQHQLQQHQPFQRFSRQQQFYF